MNILPRFGSLILVCLLVITGGMSVSSAETTSVTIRENDTLSTIVQAAYPEIRNRAPIMQLILQRNPKAFRNNDINFLIIGEVLELPGAEELAALNLPAVQRNAVAATQQANQASPVDTETVQRLQRIEQERDTLKNQVQQLEADNKTLRDNVAQLEQVKDKQDEQLIQLEQQTEMLQEPVKQQAAVATDTAAANTATEKLQQEITALNATISGLQTEKNTLQAKMADLEIKQAALQSEKGSLAEQVSQFKQTLSELESTNKTQIEANTKLQEQTTLLQQDSDILRSDNEQLQADLQATKDQLVTSDLDMETLRADLDVLDKKNIALQSELDQIKAAAANDVTLAPTEPQKQSATSLWPWLLMLCLLPVAWFMGQRSRPAPALASAAVTAGVTDHQAAIDPVVPAPMTRDEIDSGEFGRTVAAIPDDPDVAIKLDMARAYLDLRNAEAANDVLQEVIREGGSKQQQAAKEILSFIS